MCFYLFDDEDKITKEDRKRNNLFYLLIDSSVGGPSIIFNRYHEANKTYISGFKAKAGSSHILTWTAWVQFPPSPTHDTCLCCSAMSCLMKLASLDTSRIPACYLDISRIPACYLDTSRIKVVRELGFSFQE